MKKIVVVYPHSHSWLWTQTAISSIIRNPPRCDGFEVQVVIVDNSDWSPSIRGTTETELGRNVTVIPNHKGNKFHASALDCVVETMDFDFMMAMETDVLALRPGWLAWFMKQMRETDFAVGHFHHEQFINPSCTLYRGSVLRDMMKWCKANKEPTTLRWGPLFGKSQPIENREPERDYRDWFNSNVDWIIGPFADKRGWPAGTELKEKPSGQEKGVSWYEPGQMLHHWAVEEGYTYTVCPTTTTRIRPVNDELPCQTFYGDGITDCGRQMEISEMWDYAETVHLWGGTRALDVIKHAVTCQFVGSNTPFWLEREARFWRDSVPVEVQRQTLELIAKYGWHYRGQGSDHVSQRDRDAAAFVQSCYERGGIKFLS